MAVPGAPQNLRVVGALPEEDQTFYGNVVYDSSVGYWTIDRFAGNTGAGIWPYQGAAREVGGLQRIECVVETPYGILVGINNLYFDAPDLYLVKNGLFRLFMDKEGDLEGPLEFCQSGIPVWNSFDNSIYITGPYCIRKIYRDTDGRFKVAIVAGTPYTSGTSDGAALSATFRTCRGIVAPQDGSIYWMEASPVIRKFSGGTVSTLTMTGDGSPLWHPLGWDRYLVSAGEDSSSLYISDHYASSGNYGQNIRKANLSTNALSIIIGVNKDADNWNVEIDGAPLTSASFRNGCMGYYHPGYNAVLLYSQDGARHRWSRMSGDSWVRTIFGTLRPTTSPTTFGITELNSIGQDGEQFRMADTTNAHPYIVGIGSHGGVYATNINDASGLWRVYDNRYGATTPLIGSTSVGGSARIYASIVDTTGANTITPLEVAASSSGVQVNPRVACYNGTYLAVWSDLENETNFRIRGVRLNSSGSALDATPIEISGGTRTQSMPDVAADDTGFVVVWSGYDADEILPQIFAVRVDSDGTVGTVSAITNGATPRIAWNANESKHLVMYVSAAGTGTSTCRLSKHWFLMDHSLSVTTCSDYIECAHTYGRVAGRYSVCSCPDVGQGWTLVIDNSPTRDEWGRSYGIQRTVNINPSGAVAADFPEPHDAYTPSGGTPYDNWLDYHGNLTDLFPVGISAVAPDADYCVAVWPRYHYGGYVYAEMRYSLFDADLVASRINRWEPQESPVDVATSSVSERNPALSGDGAGNMVLVYEKLVAENPQIVSRPLTIGESITVGSEVAIMDAADTQRGLPAICYGGSSKFMVVWQEGWAGEDLSQEHTLPNPTDTTTLEQDGGETPEQISMFLPGTYAEADTATLRYKVTGTDNWIQGHDMFNIRSAPAGKLGFAWTIIDLTPGTSYDIEVVTDVSGVGQVYTATFSTRSLPAVAGAPNKSISSDIQGALNDADPGDVIEIQNGEYTVSSLTMTVSGTEGSPIYIRGESRDGVILTDTSGVVLSISNASNIIFENMTITGSGVDSGIAASSIGIKLSGTSGGGGCNSVTLRNLTVTGVDQGVICNTSTFVITKLLVYDNTIEGNNEYLQDLYGHYGTGTYLTDLSDYQGEWNSGTTYATGDLVKIAMGNDGYPAHDVYYGYRSLQDNNLNHVPYVYPSTEPNPTWWERQSNFPDGVYDINDNIFYNDEGIAILGHACCAFNNTISGFGDALGLHSGDQTNFFTACHFYRNNILWTGDDGFESDSGWGTRNITCYDNRFTNAQTLLSCQAFEGGPLLFCRNIGINIARPFMKWNSTNSSGFFVYNNTMLRTASNWNTAHNRSFLQDTMLSFSEVGFQNNIVMYLGADSLPSGKTFYVSSGIDRLDWTHNSYYPDGYFVWNHYSSTPRTLAQLKAWMPDSDPVFSGQVKRNYQDNICESNPFETAIVQGSNNLTKVSTQYTPILSASTICRGSGVPIFGVTDGYSGAAPDRGAIISGRTIPTYGDRS